MTRALGRASLVLLLLWALAQFVLTIRMGYTRTGSDFLDTLPEAFLNRPPDLLSNFPNSIRGATYLHGPTQYLTVLPLVFAGSAAAIERILFPLYGVVIVVAALVSRRTFEKAAAGPVPWVPIVAATVAFPPVEHAWVDCEFEVVILLAFTAAMYAAVHNRFATVGALIAYISLYKYMPLIAVAYLVVRRWWRSLAGFAATAAVIVLLAHVVFGLEGFANNNIGAKGAELLTGLNTPAFCAPTEIRSEGPQPDIEDESIRGSLCEIGSLIAVPPQFLYLGIVGITLGLCAVGTMRLERAVRVLESTEQWRRILELGIIATVSVTFFFTHYYYLSLLILPMSALLARFTSGGRRWTPGLILLALAYFLVGCFLARPGPIERWFGVDLWTLARDTSALFAGEMITLGLLLHQYVTLPISPGPAPASAVRRV